MHSDVWGPAPVESKGGKRYYVTFINNKSHLMTLHLLKTKDEVTGVYKQYEAWVETQMEAKIKILNSDRGGEYQGNNFIKYLKSKGTIQKLNIHDTPQHAGVAEQLEKGSRLFFMQAVFLSFCGEKRLVTVRGCHSTTYISPTKCQAKLDIASFWRTWLCGWSFPNSHIVWILNRMMMKAVEGMTLMSFPELCYR